MNKFITKVAKLVLGLSLAAGVGVAVGSNKASKADAAIPSGNELLFTINFKDNGTDSSTALTTSNFYSNGITSVTDKNGNTVTSTFSSAGVGSTSKCYAGTGGLKCGSNKNAADFTLNIPSAYQTKFTYAVINCTNATRNITLTAGGGSDTLSSGNSSFGDHELNIGSTSNATTLAVSIASASKTAAYIASIAIYKTSSGSGDPEKLGTPSPVFNRADNTITWSSVAHATSYELKVDSGSYSTATSGYSVASVSVNDPHTVSVKALANGYTTSDEGSVTFKRFATKGTQTDPFTVADARRFIDTLGAATSDNVYVSGIISQVDTYDSSHHSITYWISDDGLTTSDQIEVYSGKGLNNTDFSAVTDVTEGAEVTILGALKLYNSTYEFNYNNYLVAYTAPAGKLTNPAPTYNASNQTISWAADANADHYEAKIDSGSYSTVTSPLSVSSYSSDAVHTLTIKAVGDGVSYTDSDEVGYKFALLPVNDSAHPYTVSQAILAIDTDHDLTGLYTTGIVCGYYNSGYSTTPTLSSGKLSFYISADGSEGQDGDGIATRIEAYHCYKASGSTTFADVSEVPPIGATVIIYGNLKSYTPSGKPKVYEYDSDCYLTSVSTPSYTVSFNGNGASGTMSSVTDQFGTYTLPANGFTTPANQMFAGWKANNSGDLIEAGGTYTVSGDVTFYAQWVNVYTVTYTAGTNGTGSFADSNKPEGEYTLLAFNDLTGVSADSGYRFKNYTVGGINKNPGDTITLSSATAITVNFEEGAADSSVTTVIATYASNNSWANQSQYLTMHLDSNVTATVDGGGNSGKYYSNDESWRLYSSESATLTISVPSGCTLVSATLTFPSTDSPAVTYGGNAVTSDVAVSLSGTSAVFSVDSGKLHLTDINVVYTPSGVSYTISYDANGGTGTMADTTGVAPEVQACTFTAPAGKQFASWNDEEDGSGTEYAVGSTVTANVTLFAIWETPAALPTEYFTQITSLSDVSDGKYLIAYGDLCFDGSLASLDASGNTKAISLANLLTSYFTIDKTAGTILSASGKYIGEASDSNGLTSSDTEMTNTISFDGEGNLVVVSSGGAYLRYNSSTGQERFRYFKSSTYTAQKAIQLYKVNIGKAILDGMTCDASGENAPTGSWANLKSYYNTLSTSDKAALVTETANEGGTQIQQAMARYDYIVGKYGTSTYENFIGRTVTPIGSGAKLLANVIGENTNTVAIIVIISMVSVTAI